MDDMVPSASRKPPQSDPIGDAIKSFVKSPIGIALIVIALAILIFSSVSSYNEKEAYFDRAAHCVGIYPNAGPGYAECLSR